MSTSVGNIDTLILNMTTDKKPFECDFDGCDYVCSTPSILKVHKMKHAGDKPFKCDFEGCRYSCYRSSHFKVHGRTHTK